MKKILLLILICLPFFSFAQMSYGIKGGFTAGLQKWNQFNRDPLLSYNGSIFLDGSQDGKFSFFGETGYHRKGSALRFNKSFYTNSSGQTVEVPARTINTVFHNVSLVLGAKSRYNWSKKMTGYYLFGLRADVNVKHSNNFAYSSINDFVNRFTYGLTVGGGVEWVLSEKMDILLELQVSPDIGRQVYVPQGTYYNHYTRRNETTPEQKITNTVLEIMVGFRFKNTYEE